MVEKCEEWQKMVGVPNTGCSLLVSSSGVDFQLTCFGLSALIPDSCRSLESSTTFVKCRILCALLAASRANITSRSVNLTAALLWLLLFCLLLTPVSQCMVAELVEGKKSRLHFLIEHRASISPSDQAACAAR